MSYFNVESFCSPPSSEENKNIYSIYTHIFGYSPLYGAIPPFFLSRPLISMPQITNINFPLSLINCLLYYSGIPST